MNQKVAVPTLHTACFSIRAMSRMFPPLDFIGPQRRIGFFLRHGNVLPVPVFGLDHFRHLGGRAATVITDFRGA